MPGSQKGFFLTRLHPSVTFISVNVLVFQNPPHGNSNPFCGGSMDVFWNYKQSLFTNVPLEECIDLAVKYISEGNPDLKLTPSDLKCLFTFATAETHFLFKGSFYDQMASSEHFVNFLGRI